MLRCWQRDPQQRPSFTVVVNGVEQILTGLGGYLDIDAEAKLNISCVNLASNVEDDAHQEAAQGEDVDKDVVHQGTLEMYEV